MSARKKILLVDDVKLFLKLEETFFRRTGCEIITASSGEEAVSKSRETQPDLILLDYIMPDMMGDEVIRRLKADQATTDIPIMIVSTSADEMDMNKCFEAGALEYVTKPINAQELLAKAANVLNIPHRVHFRVPVRIDVEGESGGKSFTGLSRNVSLGGILVDSQEELPALSRVILNLPILPDQANLRLHGRVVRVDQDQANKSFLLGMQFLNVTASQEAAINDFLSKHRDEPAGQA